jgi:hypothetical protein
VLRVRPALLLAAALSILAGCARRMDMYDQPRGKGLRENTFFADGKGAREPPQGTVARGFLRDDIHLYQGRSNDTTFANIFPMPVTRAVLERGRQRYDIFCTVCHDAVGNGRGMVVQRGFKQPPTMHQDRLRDAPVGYLYDVVTNGFATMSGYAPQIPVEDRWAIVAYLRVLQASQNVKLAELSTDDRARFEAALREAPPQGGEPHGGTPEDTHGGTSKDAHGGGHEERR